MYLVESVFDIVYLALVVLLGIKLLLQNQPKARLFGLMAVVLGLGDSFHLVPRVISMWSDSGFAGHVAALSYGQMATSITMTVFYLILYLFFKQMTGRKDLKLDLAVYLLVAFRIVLSLMPQNAWGTAQGNYSWDLIRNLPFAILGGTLVVTFLKEGKKQPLFKNLAIAIIVSFACYLPVVLWAKVVPAVGALMLPKTAAYVAVVVIGYRYFIKDFKAQSLLENSFVYLIAGLVAGVFSREFTKFRSFDGDSLLKVVHPHLLGLGMMLSLLLFFWLNIQERSHFKGFEKSVFLMNTGLLLTSVMLVLRGMIQVLGNYFQTIPSAAVAGMAGLGHITLAIGLVWTLLLVVKSPTPLVVVASKS